MAKNEEEMIENIYGFSKSMKGYNTKEVDLFLEKFKENNDNAIKSYEARLNEYKDETDILRCESDRLKNDLEKQKEIASQAIANADSVREKYKKGQKSFEKLDDLEKENASLKSALEKALKEKESAERDALRASVDKKNAKEKFEQVKAELAQVKNELKEAKENPSNSSVAVKEEVTPAQQAVSSSPISESEAQKELQQLVGAYTLHLKKTRQIVDTLVDQLNKADGII